MIKKLYEYLQKMMCETYGNSNRQYATWPLQRRLKTSGIREAQRTTMVILAVRTRHNPYHFPLRCR